MILERSVPPFGEEVSTLSVVEGLVVTAKMLGGPDASFVSGTIVGLWCHDYCDSIAL